MWRQERKYSLDALLDHPVLALAMRSMGMDRQAVELLLEAPPPVREPDRFGNPVPACVPPDAGDAGLASVHPEQFFAPGQTRSSRTTNGR